MAMTRGGIAADQAAKDEARIRELIERYASLFAAHNAEAWMALWDDEGVQLPPNDSMHVGKEAIRNANASFIADQSLSFGFEITTQEVLLFDGTYGLARGVYTLSATPTGGGQAVVTDGKFMSVLRKQADGRWLFFRDCFNSNTPVS